MSQPGGARQQVLGELSRWLIGSYRPEPGWTELHLQLRPLRDEVRFRLIEVRGEERKGRLGKLTQGQAPHELARRLQDEGIRPGAGTWIEASLTLTPGTPPEITVAGRFNHDSDPQPWQEDTTAFDATDLVHHLTRYPRRPEAVPAWMSERITAAGLEVPGPAGEGSATAAADAGVAGGGPTDATSWDPTAVPEVAGTFLESDFPADAPTTHAPAADDRPRPEALDIVVNRDGPLLTDGTRPGRRRLRLGGSLGLADVLETVGIPLPFVDDRGTWIVRHSESRDTGAVLAVVEQGPGASTGGVPESRVHVLSTARPADLLDDEGRLTLYYCSVPGELQVVLDSARLGEVARPPTPSTPPDNELVRTAVAEFAAEPGPARKLHVLRQVLGGRLVVDATGSELPAPGEKSPQLRLTTLTAADGSRALAAFTSNEKLVEFRKSGGKDVPAKVTGVGQSGPQLLDMFRRTEELEWFLIDPAGPSCSIGRKEVEFALATPSARGVKDLLATTFTMQELVAALSEPDLSLYLAHTETDGRSGPVLVRDQGDGRPVLLAFTSAVEVAAYNAKFGARRVPVGVVLELAVANRAKAVLINPSGPRAVLPLAQVWHALDQPELPPERPASEPSDTSSSGEESSDQPVGGAPSGGTAADGEPSAPRSPDDPPVAEP